MGNSRPIPESLVELIGPPIPRQRLPNQFFVGNDFLKNIAGITIVPTAIAQTLPPHNQSPVNQPEQGAK